MRAMAMTAYDSGLSPANLPAPEPGDGELCVRVSATSLNRFDVLAAKGFLQRVIEYQFPAVPGMDFAAA